MAEQDKQGLKFNILSKDATKGDGGFGAGVIDLNNVTPIIIDPEDGKAFIDKDALHARSSVEKKVRFTPEREHAGENPKLYWIVWTALTTSEAGPYFSGCAACEILVARDTEKRIKPGYKSMPEHVNHLDKAMKGKFILNHMDAASKKILKDFLLTYKEYWDRSSDDLKQQLSS